MQRYLTKIIHLHSHSIPTTNTHTKTHLSKNKAKRINDENDNNDNKKLYTKRNKTCTNEENFKIPKKKTNVAISMKKKFIVVAFFCYEHVCVCRCVYYVLWLWWLFIVLLPIYCDCEWSMNSALIRWESHHLAYEAISLKATQKFIKTMIWIGWSS